MEKGTTNASSTNPSGIFRFNVKNNAILVICFIVYNSQEIPVSNKTAIEISLNPSNVTLNNVVVIGYGTQRKVDVTGPVVAISENKIKNRPSTNALEELAGQVVGINITSNSGRLGDYCINISGFNSINASNNPLFVIDGAMGVSSEPYPKIPGETLFISYSPGGYGC